MPKPQRTKIVHYLTALRRFKVPGAPVTLAELEATLDAAVSLVGADRGFLVVPDRKTELRVLAARGLGTEPLEEGDRMVSRTLYRHAVSKKQAILVSPVALHPLFADVATAPTFRARARSAITATLLLRGKTLGVLMLHESRRASVFDTDELEAVELLADEAAAVLANFLATGAAARAPREEESLLVGESVKMVALRSRVQGLADSPSTVLVTGERGTGKELVARELHATGSRARKPFVAEALNALSPTLVESQLFGCVKGAFTGADKDRRGLFLEAEDGTLFLDEIGELSLEVQAKLLRALQEKVVRPLGGEGVKKVRARVVAATNKDLAALVAAGEFRADLHDRLMAVHVTTPPLRERRDDIPLLVRHLLPLLAAEEMRPVPELDREVVAALQEHDWPGNVRELENKLRAAVFWEEGPVTAAALGVAKPAKVKTRRKRKPVRKLTREEIEEAIREAKGNKRAAARNLGVGKSTLYRELDGEGDARGEKG